MAPQEKKFGIIGVAGFVAPRHLRAVRDTGSTLSCALDPNDSVGVIDQYFPGAHFFTEFERFDRHVDLLRRRGEGLDYVSVCSPNYLHDAHIRFGLRAGASVICEKPVVINPWNLDGLAEIESEFDGSISTILQLRLHPSVVAIREAVAAEPQRKYEVDLSYVTARGNWYQASWKGDESKSGGIATNIGIHFFDMLGWIFGPLQTLQVHGSGARKMAGFIEFERARVRWFLSVDGADLPAATSTAGGKTYRSITIDGEEVEFSSGFDDLHLLSYESVLAGRGFGLDDARPSIELVHQVRHATPRGLSGDYHPFLKEAAVEF